MTIAPTITTTTDTATGSALAATTSLTDLKERWLRYVQRSEATRRAYNASLKDFLGWLKENGITAPQRNDIIDYGNARLAEGRKPTTLKLRMVAVRLFFQWTALEGLYPNVADRVENPAKVDSLHKRDFLAPEAVASTLNHAIGKGDLEQARNRAVLLIMACCGLRTIEVVQSDIQDFTTTGGRFTLKVQGKGHTEKGITIPVDEGTAQAIGEYLRLRGPVRAEEPLFASHGPRNNGGRMTTGSVSRIAKWSMRAAGIDSARLTAHSLRHSAIMLTYQAQKERHEVNPVELQIFARHRSFNTTLIYVHEGDTLANSCNGLAAAEIFKAWRKE